MDYYPKIYKFKDEQMARDKYNELVDEDLQENPDQDMCVFIGEVKDYSKSEDYDMEHNPY